MYFGVPKTDAGLIFCGTSPVLRKRWLLIFDWCPERESNPHAISDTRF